MLGFGKSKEEKELEKQQKLDTKYQKQEDKAQQKLLKRQQQENKKAADKLKKEGLAKFVLPAISGYEELLYSFGFQEGTFKTKIVKMHYVTTHRVVTVLSETNEMFSISLEDISDAVPVNVHRTYSGRFQGVSAGGRGFRSTVGSTKGKSVQIGDIIISSPVTQDQIWDEIPSCAEVINLIKSQRKNRLQQLDK